MDQKKKISESEKRLLFILFAVLVLAGSYFMVFQKFSEEAEALETTNATDAARVQQLQMMEAQKDIVEQQTEDYNRAAELIVAMYPSDMTQEKATEVIWELENYTGAEVTGISYVMGNLVTNVSSMITATNATAADAASSDTTSSDTTSSDTDYDALTESADTAAADTSASDASGGTADTENSAVLGCYAALTVNFSVDYDGYKKLAKYVTEQEDRMTVPAISVSYDETTGLLTGAATIDLYYLTNTGKEYEAPVFTGISKGVDNVFHTGFSAGSEDGGEADDGTDAQDGETADAGETTE